MHAIYRRSESVLLPVQYESLAYMYKSYKDPGQWGTLPQDINPILAAGSSDGKVNQWVRTGYAYYPIDVTSPEGAGF